MIGKIRLGEIEFRIFNLQFEKAKNFNLIQGLIDLNIKSYFKVLILKPVYWLKSWLNKSI